MSGSPRPTVRPRSAAALLTLAAVPALLLAAPALAGSEISPARCVTVEVPAGTGTAWVAVQALPSLTPVGVADDGLLVTRGTVQAPVTLPAGAAAEALRVVLTLDGVEQPAVDVPDLTCAEPAPATATATATIATATAMLATGALRANQAVAAPTPLGRGTSSSVGLAAAPLPGAGVAAAVGSPLTSPGVAALAPLVAPPLVAPPLVTSPLLAVPQVAGPSLSARDDLSALLPEAPVGPARVRALPIEVAPRDAIPAYADLAPAAVLLSGSLAGLVGFARRRTV